MKALRTLAWVLRKDLWLFFADRNGAILTLVTPVMLAALLGMLFAPRDKAGQLEVLVAAVEQGPRGAALIEALDASDAVMVVRVDEATARERIAHGDASVALLLPVGTEQALAPTALFAGGGGALDLPLLYDPSDDVEASLAEGLITQQVMQGLARAFTDPGAVRDMLGAARATIRLAEASGVYSGPAGLGRVLDDAFGIAGKEADKPDAPGGGGFKLPVRLVKQQVVAAGPTAGYNSFAHNFAGMLCMFILFMGVERATGLARERDGGTLLRLRLAPVDRDLVLVGSALATIVIGLLISAAVYLAAIVFFGVRILGSPVGFALVVLAQAVFVAGFGLLLSSVGRTETQIGNIGRVPVLVMSFIGGAAMPSFVMPDWVQAAAHAVPTYWATRGLAAMTWRGLPFGEALMPCAVLFGAGLVLGWVGVKRFRWA